MEREDGADDQRDEDEDARVLDGGLARLVAHPALLVTSDLLGALDERVESVLRVDGQRDRLVLQVSTDGVHVVEPPGRKVDRSTEDEATVNLEDPLEAGGSS
jgi:hypothetical protein